MRRMLLLIVPLFILSACPQPDPPAPEPGEFLAGSAEVRMPVPIGIGTVGNNGIFGAPDNPSPYADRYPATERLHGHADFTAVALSRGPGFELIIVRSDTIAMLQQIRDAVVAELQDRTGRDLDHALVIGATHTHSGPGRFVQGGMYNVIADYFVPEFYVGVVNAMADAVELALADLGPAEVGVGMALAPDCHSDRRCEDMEDYTNDQLGLISVRKDGEITALLLNYAIHGTILGIDDFTLSKDVSGGIEERVEALFDHPVHVALINSWAADVAPSSPGLPPVDDPSLLPGGYDRMDEIGLYLADIVQTALPDIVYTTEPDVRAHTYRYALNREAIGYDYSEFEYEYGAVYCETVNETCEEPLNHPDLTDGCIPFNEDSPAPDRTVVTVGTLAGTNFVTWAGEPGTRLAEELMDLMRDTGASNDVLFFGYAQDYIGYAIQEDDWWHGGYEASGAMWGPRQGDYMLSVAADAFEHWVTLSEEPPRFEEPGKPPAFSLVDGVVWAAEQAVDAGAIETQPEPTYVGSAVASFVVLGDDPLFGAPVASLHQQVGDDFEPLLSGGLPVASDGYAFWVDLAPEPSYDETLEPTPRRFRWVFNLPLRTRVRDLSAAGGLYRFEVQVPRADGSVDTLTTDAFGFE